MKKRTAAPVPTLSIASALERAARTESGIFFQQEDGRVSFKSYATLEVEASRIARALRDRLVDGERVGIVLADPEAFLGVFFGTVVGGFIPVLLSPPASLGSAVAQLCRQIEAARPGLVVTTHGLLPALSGALSPGCLATPDELASAEPLRDRVTAADPALAIPGTDGVRLISLAQVSEVVEAFGGRESMPLAQQEIVGSLLPLSQPAGLLATLLAPVWRGASLLLLHPLAFLRAPLESLRLLSTYRTSACFLPESAMNQISRRITAPELAGIRLGSLRAIGHAGAAEPVTLVRLLALLGPAGLSEKALLAGTRVARSCAELLEKGTLVAPPAERSSVPAAPTTGGSPRLRLSGSLFSVAAASQANGPRALRAAIVRALGL